jgi:hypothetical protein
VRYIDTAVYIRIEIDCSFTIVKKRVMAHVGMRKLYASYIKLNKKKKVHLWIVSCPGDKKNEPTGARMGVFWSGRGGRKVEGKK